MQSIAINQFKARYSKAGVNSFWDVDQTLCILKLNSIQMSDSDFGDWTD